MLKINDSRLLEEVIISWEWFNNMSAKYQQELVELFVNLILQDEWENLGSTAKAEIQHQYENPILENDKWYSRLWS